MTIPTLTLEVGLFTQISGLSAQVDVMEYLEGGVNTFVHRLPSRIKQGNVTPKRGVTTEKALLTWFQSTVIKAQPDRPARSPILDEAGNTVQTWSSRNAYPVKRTGSDLNAGGNEFMTQSLEIAHSGMKVMEMPFGNSALPENFVRAYLEIEGGAKLDCYFNPTEYSTAQDEHLGSREGQRQVVSEPEVHRAATRARWS